MNQPLNLTLTIWRRQYLDPGWPALLKQAEFDSFSVKLIDAGRPYRSEEISSILDEGRASGLTAYGWGWTHATDRQSATQEATAAASECTRRGIQRYYVNAEKVWAGTSGEPIPADPIGNMRTFVETFRMRAPEVKLYWNGFSWQSANGRPLVTQTLLSWFDGYSPMNYGTKASSIEKKYDQRQERAQALGLPYQPMMSPGRIAKDGATWGFFNDQNSGPGLLELVRRSPPQGLAVWYGSGATGMLGQGNRENPPWTEAGPALQRAAVRGGGVS